MKDSFVIKPARGLILNAIKMNIIPGPAAMNHSIGQTDTKNTSIFIIFIVLPNAVFAASAAYPRPEYSFLNPFPKYKNRQSLLYMIQITIASHFINCKSYPS